VPVCGCAKVNSHIHEEICGFLFLQSTKKYPFGCGQKLPEYSEFSSSLSLNLFFLHNKSSELKQTSHGGKRYKDGPEMQSEI